MRRRAPIPLHSCGGPIEAVRVSTNSTISSSFRCIRAAAPLKLVIDVLVGWDFPTFRCIRAAAPLKLDGTDHVRHHRGPAFRCIRAAAPLKPAAARAYHLRRSYIPLHSCGGPIEARPRAWTATRRPDIPLHSCGGPIEAYTACAWSIARRFIPLHSCGGPIEARPWSTPPIPPSAFRCIRAAAPLKLVPCEACAGLCFAHSAAFVRRPH